MLLVPSLRIIYLVLESKDFYPVFFSLEILQFLVLY